MSASCPEILNYFFKLEKPGDESSQQELQLWCQILALMAYASIWSGFFFSRPICKELNEYVNMNMIIYWGHCRELHDYNQTCVSPAGRVRGTRQVWGEVESCLWSVDITCWPVMCMHKKIQCFSKYSLLHIMSHYNHKLQSILLGFYVMHQHKVVHHREVEGNK